MDTRYLERRCGIEQFFVPQKKIADSATVVTSPCGRYLLEICHYSTKPNCWDYSRGIVTRRADGEILADVKRNYGQFWHAWVDHPNGNTYLLCGEDYQGYSVLNVTQGISQTFFPEAGYNGYGFCWTAVYPSPDGLMLAVDGCYWACSYDLVFYDFRSPEELPLPELERIASLDDCKGWRDNDTIILTREIEVRKHDGVLYDSLTDEEQDILDNDDSLVEYRTETVHYTRPTWDKNSDRNTDNS